MHLIYCNKNTPIHFIESQIFNACKQHNLEGSFYAFSDSTQISPNFSVVLDYTDTISFDETKVLFIINFFNGEIKTTLKQCFIYV